MSTLEAVLFLVAFFRFLISAVVFIRIIIKFIKEVVKKTSQKVAEFALIFFAPLVSFLYFAYEKSLKEADGDPEKEELARWEFRSQLIIGFPIDLISGALATIAIYQEYLSRWIPL